MIIKIFNKSIALILTFIFILGLFPAVMYAQPNPAPADIKGFNNSVFESRFSRADREINPERWLFEARLGITQAIFAWELVAEGLYENPVLFNEAKNKIEKWSADELEERFSRWLTGRFFSAALEKSLFDFSSTIDETQKKYSWHLDDEGNIIYDGRTGDPLIIRPDDGREFSSDLLMWRGEAQDIVSQKGVRFDAMLTGLYTELLAYIPDELRETMNAVIRETGANISGTIKREFENIAAREERIFTSRRTRDIQSLRRKNDDEAARLFTQRLISETEEICARGIKDLTARIEAAAAGTGDLALLGGEWLSLYKEQFDRGLKAWEEAEERFFIRRIEWEQESFRLYSEGEEMWLAAFNQFEEERRNWELKAKDLFDSGEAMFKNISEDFEKSIAEAKHEFEINKAMRIGEGTTKVKALVDMYLICSSAAFSAMDNLQYWYEQYKDPNKVNPKDQNFNAWLLQEESKSKNSLLAEVRKSYDLYVSYMEKALDARDRILANYAELIGTGALKDILSPDASSEDFYLDEYQIALIRAKALVLYWERKTEIANAVMNYANDLSAGRMTEAEGIYAWEAAKAAYNASLSVYETELKKLNIIGEDIQKQQEILHGIAQQMLLEEEKLNRLNSEYSIYFNASIINRSDYYIIELNQVYEYLEREYKSFLLSGEKAEYKEIIEYGIKWDTAEIREASEIVLNMLINGLGGHLSSLTELRRNVIEGKESEINLIVRLAAIDLFADNSSGQLRTVNSKYSGADWYSKAKGLNLTNEEKAALYGEKLKAQIETDYKNSFTILLEKRLELELNSLKNINNSNPVPEDFVFIPPEFCFINEETSAYVYEILLALKERMELGKPFYTEDDEENEVINYFLSGYSFFIDSEKYLTEYYNEYYLCSGLFDIFNEYANISSFSKREYWLDTCNSLKSFFSGYGFNQSSGFLPDIQSICESILKRPGDLILNSAKFLLEFESCFLTKPQWLENEIAFWENSVIEYIAAYAFYADIKSENLTEKLFDKQNETETKYNELYAYAGSLSVISDDEAAKINEALIEINNDFAVFYYAGQIKQVFDTITNKAAIAENEKHWREFLTEKYISNEEITIDAASSFKDGVLKDALFNAAYFSNRLNDAFAVSLNGNIDNLDDSAEQYFGLYYEKISEIYNRFGALPYLYNEIANAGKVYETNLIPPKILETQLKQSYEELKIQEAVFNAIRNEYLREAEIFLNIGSLYDEQYGLLKKAHDDSDIKRFEYEKQDAIQRWASTAYLGTEHIDIENYSSKLSKAQTVLAVLSDLYKDENLRNYNNPEYSKLYSEYEKSFGKKIKTLEAIETLKAEIIQEQANNQKIYVEYQSSLNKLGNVNTNYLDYISPASRAGWSIKDIITVKNGRLVFSGGNTWKLTGIDEKKAAELNDFFNTSECLEGERHEISKFEESLRALSQRMSEYFKDENKFRQWSLARDYLMNLLINNNTDLSFLNNYYSGLGQMSSNGSLGALPVKSGIFGKPEKLYSASGISGYYSASKETFKLCWDALSEDEKADLEFYVILTLSGGSLEYYYGFSQVNTLDMYNRAFNYVNEKYNYAKSQYDAWWKSVGIGLFIPGAGIARSLLYKEMRDVNSAALRRVEPVVKRTEGQVNAWTSGLKNNFSLIKKNASAYAASCERLDILEGKKANGNIVWDDIKFSLLTTGKISETNISELKSYWEAMLPESGILYDNVLEALNGLLDWTRSKEEKNKTALENQWLNDSKIQQINENNFQLALDGYINGNVNIQTLKTAAEKAYGKNAAAVKKHIDNKHTVMQNDLSLYLTVKFDFYQEFNIVGNEITALTAQILENRYNAELGAREIEWNMMLRDIKEKHDEWLVLASRIFENGRTDWAASVRKMEDAYKQWQMNFKNEYVRVSDEWNEAYLAGLEDKEKWLVQAALAANQASSQAFLTLVGTEGERLSRFMDIREPFGIRNALPETNSLIAELLQSSGIANMYGAFGSINNITSYASPIVRRGMGGSYSWDASAAKIAASDFAKKSNAEIAEMEAKVLAHRIRLTIDEALKNLADNIRTANLNFNESMDNMFIMDGLWRKSGSAYEKDIVKGSTLLTPVIEKRATVAGYVFYKMKPVSLLTNLDDKNLERLNTIAVRGLLENAYSEIEKMTAEIFGIGQDAVKIGKRGNPEEFREQAPGKFGAHIGYSPDVKPGKEFGETKNSMFYDTGSGELGRLLSEYIYWNVIDSKGYAELSLAPWDKRIWNDENSFFPAPSIKSVGQIAGAVAATVFTFGAGAGIGAVMLAAAISSASSMTFGTLDVAFGYKSLDEAAFDMGKTFLINAAGSAISGIFGVVGSTGLTSTAVNAANSTIGKIATEAAMRGLQTAATSFVTNVLSSVTYSSADGFGWSNEIFSSGINGMLKGAASSMVSTLTTGTLQAINSGVSLDKLAGFNSFNRRDLAKLNGFIGSLAGQGVSYAMGDDFTLNVLNLSDFTAGAYESGLLELHLGRNGTSMNIGTGGVNVSYSNLAASLRGAQVWNVNNRINNFIKKEETFDAAIALRAQYGYGDDVQKGRLWDILKGDTKIIADTEGDFFAQTTIVDGQRVINLSGYKLGMNMEEQMFFAVVLGHEAYRDGYKTGETDAYGNTVTAERSFSELTNASIARIAMGDRINSEYAWFYNNNMGFEFESYLLDMAQTSGDFSLFHDYLELVYNNDEDYFFQQTTTGGSFQNVKGVFETMPLFNAISVEAAKKRDDDRKKAAYNKYLEKMKEEKNNSPLTQDEFIAYDKGELAKSYNYVAFKYESIYMVGCRFFSTKYSLEALTGLYFDPIVLNNYILRNKLYYDESDLSSQNMADIMNAFSERKYNVTVVKDLPIKPSVEKLYELQESSEMYLACLQVNGASGGTHYVMLSNIEFTYDDNGKVSGISKVNVANPWSNTDSYTGHQSYTMGEINKWDIFKVTQNNSYYNPYLR